MATVLIFTLIASLIGTTLVFNHFINKSIGMLEGQHKAYKDALREWTSWAGPFTSLSGGDMEDIHRLIKVVIETDDPEEIAACKKALAEILRNDPLRLHPSGESNAD